MSHKIVICNKEMHLSFKNELTEKSALKKNNQGWIWTVFIKKDSQELGLNSGLDRRPAPNLVPEGDISHDIRDFQVFLSSIITCLSICISLVAYSIP